MTTRIEEIYSIISDIPDNHQYSYCLDVKTKIDEFVKKYLNKDQLVDGLVIRSGICSAIFLAKAKNNDFELNDLTDAVDEINNRSYNLTFENTFFRQFITTSESMRVIASNAEKMQDFMALTKEWITAEA